MANDDRLVIEVSRRSNTAIYYDYSTLFSLKPLEAGIYLVGENRIRVDSEIDSEEKLGTFEFIFIDEDEDVSSNLREILKSLPPTKKRIAIACHKGGKSISSVNAVLSEQEIVSRFKVFKPVKFSHTAHDEYSRDGLKPFFMCISNGFDNYKSYFDRLWNCIANPVREAESLVKGGVKVRRVAVENCDTWFIK